MANNKPSLAGWSWALLLAVTGVAAPDGDQRLITAVKNRDQSAVRSLLDQKADVQATQSDGATALHWAAHWDDLESADLLIRAGANARAANDYGVTPLTLACRNGNASIISALLKAGADANATLPKGESALMTCARAGSVEGVKLLVESRAQVDAQDSEQGQTALMWAAAQKHAAVAKVLIERGANLRARSKGGFTPLMFAARAGDLETARVLLAAGADVNEAMPARAVAAPVGPYGASPPAAQEGGPSSSAGQPSDSAGSMNPLLMASASGHEALAIFLLQQGANPNARDEYGATALHYSMTTGIAHLNAIAYANYQAYVFRPSLAALVKELLARGADPNARLVKGPPVGGVSSKNTIGATPFLLAAVTGDSYVMRLLAEKGADPRLATKSNFTPVMVASGLGRIQDLAEQEKKDALQAVKLAVELGGDVNAATEDGLAALHGAAVNGADAIVEYLASKGANLNVKDKYQQTPMTIASGMRLPWVPKGEELGEILQLSTRDLLLKLGATPLDAPGYFTAVEDSHEYRLNQSQRAEPPPVPTPAPQ